MVELGERVHTELGSGYISPQFHLVFDDLFETFIFQVDSKSKIEAICSDLFGSNKGWYAREEFGNDGNLIYWPPPLHNVWLDEQGRRYQKKYLSQHQKRTEDRLCDINGEIPQIIILTTKDDDHFSPRGTPISNDELSVDSSVGGTTFRIRGRP